MPAEAAVRGFLGALGVSPDSMPADLNAQAGLYRSLVAGRRILVVLDNARDTQQVIPLLPGNGHCTTLVTSRRRLTGLVTAHGARRVQVDILPEPEARELLARYLGVDRLAAEPEATVALLDICRGLPLALSVVAARAAEHLEFPLSVLAEELEEESAARLDALDTGDITANVQAVLSWSYDALDPQAATMLMLLALAPGPDISRPAAASLAALPAPQARVVLRDLENASLVQEHVPGRYRMHDLIRLYAAERARRDMPQDDLDAALLRVTDFYLCTAHSADRLLVPHRQPIDLVQPAAGTVSHRLADRAAALAWFDVEHSCLLAAQDLAVTKDWREETWQLAWALNSFHNFRGNRRDQIATWQASLTAAQLDRPDVQSLVLRTLGNVCGRVGRYSEAVDYLNQAIALAEHAGNTAEEAHSHRALARASVLQGDYRQGLRHASHAVRIYQVLGKPAWEAEALNEEGLCQAHLGDLSQARASCEASLALAEQQGDREGVGYALDNLAYIVLQDGQYAEGIGFHERAFAVWGELDHRYNQAGNLDGLAKAHTALGHRDEARRAWEQALDLYKAQQRSADVERIQQQLDLLSGLPGTANC